MRLALILILLLSSLLQPGLQAQNRLFESDEIITLKVEAPLGKIFENRSDDAPDYPARIIYKDGKEKVDILGELEIRGNYRRRADICPFPPLRLKIKKDERAGTIFEAQKKLKIVTHCQGEEYLLREYMIYKFYQMLTPYAYKVRLVKIQYRDTQNNIAPVNAYAFFIESNKTLKDRLEGETLDEKLKIPVADVSHDHLTLLHTFQFMIGNLDWGITHRKNMTLLKREENGEIIPIPYDFDFAACVQAPYTGLEKGFDRRNFRQICRTRAEYEVLFDMLRRKREQLKSLFMEFKLIPKEKREEALMYLNEFYQIIGDEQKIEEIFISACPSR